MRAVATGSLGCLAALLLGRDDLGLLALAGLLALLGILGLGVLADDGGLSALALGGFARGTVLGERRQSCRGREGDGENEFLHVDGLGL